MSVVNERPGVIELTGAAVNASDLSPREGVLGAVERVAALAYTQMNPGALEHSATEQIEIDPGSELAAVLIRLKAGGQRREAERALQLLVQWIRHQRAYAKWKVRDGDSLVHTFARRALFEWLNDTCPECGGAAWRGLERDSLMTKRTACRPCRGSGRVDYLSVGMLNAQGRWVGGVAGECGKWMRRICAACGGNGKRFQDKVRAIKPKECSDCRGTGRRLADDAGRASVLGVPALTYQKHWLRRFEWLSARLDRLDRLETNLLRSALR